MSERQVQKKASLRTAFRLILGVFFMSALAVLARRYSLPSCAAIQGQIVSWGAWAPMVFFLIYVLATIAFVPGVLVTLLGGLAFGAWWGTLIVLSASTTGAILAFLIARYIARDAIQGFMARQGWYQRFQKGVTENGLNFVLFVRLVPLFPFNALNYACGLAPIRLRDYFLGSLVGMLPGTFAYVYLGETGCKLIDPVIAGQFRPTDMPAEVRQSLVLAISLLAFLSILPVLLRAFQKYRHPEGKSSF